MNCDNTKTSKERNPNEYYGNEKNYYAAGEPVVSVFCQTHVDARDAILTAVVMQQQAVVRQSRRVQ